MKSTSQGSNDGELLCPKYLHRVQSEAPEGAMGLAEGAIALIARTWLRACIGRREKWKKRSNARENDNNTFLNTMDTLFDAHDIT